MESGKLHYNLALLSWFLAGISWFVSHIALLAGLAAIVASVFSAMAAWEKRCFIREERKKLRESPTYRARKNAQWWRRGD